MINNLNNKSQIATTLTWFVGFIIVFFIIVIFLSGTAVLSARKIVTYGNDEIKIGTYEGDFRSQEILIGLLNSNINFSGKEVFLKNILSEIDMYNLEDSKKQELANILKEKLTGLKNSDDCYVLQALWGITNPQEMIAKTDSRGQGYVSDFIKKNSLKISSYDVKNIDLRGVNYLTSEETEKLKKSADLVLIRNTKRNVFGVDEPDYQVVNIKFYIGAC